MREKDPLLKLAEYDVQRKANYNKEKKGILIFCAIVIFTIVTGVGIKNCKKSKTPQDSLASRNEAYIQQCDRWASIANSKAITQRTKQFNQLSGLYHNTYCPGGVAQHYPQDILGEWDSSMGNSNGFALLLDVEGKYILRRTFIDGSAVVENITKQGEQYTSITIDGQFYKIGTNGSLQVYDNNGFVRSLPPVSRPKD